MDIEFFGIVPGVGTVIANENTMHVAKNLLEEIESFGRRNPGHQKSVDSLTTAVKRIENEFSITRLADNHFYLLSAAVSELRDFDLLNHRILETEDVNINNITDAVVSSSARCSKLR